MKLLETIRVRNKVFCNIQYHNNRFNDSRKALFGIHEEVNLPELIKIPENISNEAYKCRLIYSENIDLIEFTPYVPKKIESLKLLKNDAIEYNFKYLDRSDFDKMKINSKADDILIVKNGYITDTSFSNIAFYDGTKWFTPSTYLLKGTMWTYLIESGQIKETEIKPADLKKFKYAKLINAMLDLDNSQAIDIENIQ